MDILTVLLILGMKGEQFSLLALSVRLAVGFSQIPFINSRTFSTIISFLRVFYFVSFTINGCQTLSDIFSIAIQMIIFFHLYSVNLKYIDRFLSIEPTLPAPV